jgi:hypothetical protein
LAIISSAIRARLIGHSGPLLTATKNIDNRLSEAAVLAKLMLS